MGGQTSISDRRSSIQMEMRGDYLLALASVVKPTKAVKKLSKIDPGMLRVDVSKGRAVNRKECMRHGL